MSTVFVQDAYYAEVKSDGGSNCLQVTYMLLSSEIWVWHLLSRKKYCRLK